MHAFSYKRIQSSYKIKPDIVVAECAVDRKPIESMIPSGTDDSIIATVTKQDMSSRGRILLVDDEIDVIKTLKDGLTLAGFEVDAYTDSEDALSHYRRDAYDLVILDVRMPKINGFELCKEIRKRDEKIRICFMTAFEIHRAEFEKVLPSIKVDGFITKPISLADFCFSAQRMLSDGNDRVKL